MYELGQDQLISNTISTGVLFDYWFEVVEMNEAKSTVETIYT